METRDFGIFKDYGSCSSIRKIVKAIDRRFDVYYDADINKYVITQYNNYFGSIAPKDLNRDFFDNMRKTIWININGSILDEIDKNNEKIRKENEEKENNIISCMARDLYKPLRKEFLGV